MSDGRDYSRGKGGGIGGRGEGEINTSTCAFSVSSRLTWFYSFIIFFIFSWFLASSFFVTFFVHLFLVFSSLSLPCLRFVGMSGRGLCGMSYFFLITHSVLFLSTVGSLTSNYCTYWFLVVMLSFSAVSRVVSALIWIICISRVTRLQLSVRYEGAAGCCSWHFVQYQVLYRRRNLAVSDNPCFLSAGGYCSTVLILQQNVLLAAVFNYFEACQREHAFSACNIF